ncbi:MAG: lipopolysaccharide ABC transporter substrate-binding protein LptA [Arsenophonus sp. NEOnobi-MAG3]
MILAKKILINVALTSSIFILNLPAIALKSDFQQPIQIYSVKQSLDLKKNITTFTENVIIEQGSIDVRADKIIITRPNGNTKKIIIEAYGRPATFYQLQDDGKQLKGHSDKICYEMEKELVILTGNAYLEQGDSNIKSEKITYLVLSKQMKAFSDKGKRVTTILLPSQLQEKGHGVKNINYSNSK